MNGYSLVESSVDPKGKSLKDWMKAAKYSFNDMKNQWGIEDADIMQKHGIEENDDTDEAIEKAFADDVEKEYKDWQHKYDRLKFPLTLYRAVCVPKLEDIKLDKLGTDWSDDIESADCYHRHHAKDNSSIFVVKALVKRTDIDWSATVWNNLNTSFGDKEQEINLIKGKSVQVVEILTQEDEWVKINKLGKV